jgi:NitT/TauT family transport system substrate-binding protein
MRLLSAAAFAMTALLFTEGPARSEVGEIHVGKQYGLVYMQLVLMQDQKLVEKHAKELGAGDVTVDWVTLGGPAQLNDGIISGTIDFVAIGLTNLVTLWDKTHGRVDVRALSGMNAMPLILVTRNPNVHTIEDYTDASRIAVPSVKVSVQALLLDMAAEQAFGEAGRNRLDPLTVSLGHPDATTALLSGASEVDSHFSSYPYQFIELAHPGIHRVISSYDIVGRHSVSAITTTGKFREQNPKVYAAFIAALQEATDWINRDRRGAAEAYLGVTKEHTTVDDLVAMMSDPDVEFTRRPMGVQKFADFLYKIGSVKSRPESWKELYFPEAQDLDGN